MSTPTMSVTEKVTLSTMNDDCLKRIYTLASKLPSKNLGSWKPALRLARNNPELFFLVYPILFKQVFVECKEPCTDLLFLNSFSPNTTNDSVDLTFASTPNTQKPFSKSTNADLFIEYGYLEHAIELNIDIDAPMHSIAHIAEAMRLLHMDRHVEWAKVHVLCMNFNDQSKSSRHFEKRAYNPDLLVKAAEHLASCLPSITHLQITAENKHPIDCTFATTLLQSLRLKSLQVIFNFEVPAKIYRFDKPVDIRLVCSSTSFPATGINTESLEHVRLDDIPYYAGWDSYFAVNDNCSVFFPILQKASLYLSDRSFNGRYVIRRQVVSNPATTEMPLHTKTPTYSDLPPVKKAVTPSSTSPPIVHKTIEQFRDECRNMDSATQLLNIPKIDMPEVKRLNIYKCQLMCRFLDAKISCPKLVALKYSGTFRGLYAFDFNNMPHLKYVSLNILSIESDEVPYFYKMFEPIFGKGSTVVYTKIILQNLSRPLDLRKMFWPKLKHLEHWDPFNFERLLTLMLHAPNLESLKLPLLTINGYYDKKYLKRNLHALVSAMCKLLTHPLKKLEMNYFKTGSDSTCYAFAIKFVIHVFKQLKELKVNDTYSDIVKDIVFRALGKKFRHLKINGDTWDEYFATNIR